MLHNRLFAMVARKKLRASPTKENINSQAHAAFRQSFYRLICMLSKEELEELASYAIEAVGEKVYNELKNKITRNALVYHGYRITSTNKEMLLEVRRIFMRKELGATDLINYLQSFSDLACIAWKHNEDQLSNLIESQSLVKELIDELSCLCEANSARDSHELFIIEKSSATTRYSDENQLQVEVCSRICAAGLYDAILKAHSGTASPHKRMNRMQSTSFQIGSDFSIQ